MFQTIIAEKLTTIDVRPGIDIRRSPIKLHLLPAFKKIYSLQIYSVRQ